MSHTPFTSGTEPGDHLNAHLCTSKLNYSIGETLSPPRCFAGAHLGYLIGRSLGLESSTTYDNHRMHSLKRFSRLSPPQSWQVSFSCYRHETRSSSRDGPRGCYLWSGKAFLRSAKPRSWRLRQFPIQLFRYKPPLIVLIASETYSCCLLKALTAAILPKFCRYLPYHPWFSAS